MVTSAEGCEGRCRWPGPVRRVRTSSLRRWLSVGTCRVAWSVLASYGERKGDLEREWHPLGQSLGSEPRWGHSTHLGAKTSA